MTNELPRPLTGSAIRTRWVMQKWQRSWVRWRRSDKPPSTINQARAGLQYLYREVLRKPLGLGKALPRPRSPFRLPVVVTPEGREEPGHGVRRGAPRAHGGPLGEGPAAVR